ncbi:MAG TPA: hypothetical protein PK006_05565 [Saprospiraceae bacterium]|nr:hypothetical protein [Saprospiraceae bacterium]
MKVTNEQFHLYKEFLILKHMSPRTHRSCCSFSYIKYNNPHENTLSLSKIEPMDRNVIPYCR